MVTALRIGTLVLDDGRSTRAIKAAHLVRYGRTGNTGTLRMTKKYLLPYSAEMIVGKMDLCQ